MAKLVVLFLTIVSLCAADGFGLPKVSQKQKISEIDFFFLFSSCSLSKHTNSLDRMDVLPIMYTFDFFFLCFFQNRLFLKNSNRLCS